MFRHIVAPLVRSVGVKCLPFMTSSLVVEGGSKADNNTGIGKKAWLFAKLQPGRARKRINAT